MTIPDGVQAHGRLPSGVAVETEKAQQEMFTARCSKEGPGWNQRERLGSQIETGREMRPDRVVLMQVAALCYGFQRSSNTGGGFFWG